MNTMRMLKIDPIVAGHYQQWWNNFRSDNGLLYVSNEIYNTALRPFNAKLKFYHSRQSYYVVFDTVEDKIAFIMRWS